MSVISKTMDAIYSYRFINLMRKPFTEWEEFKFGIIDEHGNVIRRAKTTKEKDVYTRFHQLVRVMKKNMMRYAGVSAATTLLGKSGRSNWVFENICKEYGTPSEQTLNECLLLEAEITGDAGGDAQKIASGENSGDITGPGPSGGKRLDKKKQKVE